MLIACTKSAARILNKKVEAADQHEDAFYCWHVKLFYIKNDAVLLFMNELTRLPLFLHIQKEDAAVIERQFIDLLSDIMQGMGVSDSIINSYAGNADFQYIKVYNCSIISQMNALTRVYQYEAYHNEHRCFDDQKDSVKYAQIPSFKYDLYPYQSFQAELKKRYS